MFGNSPEFLIAIQTQWSVLPRTSTTHNAQAQLTRLTHTPQFIDARTSRHTATIVCALTLLATSDVGSRSLHRTVSLAVYLG